MMWFFDAYTAANIPPHSLPLRLTPLGVREVSGSKRALLSWLSGRHRRQVVGKKATFGPF